MSNFRKDHPKLTTAFAAAAGIGFCGAGVVLAAAVVATTTPAVVAGAIACGIGMLTEKIAAKIYRDAKYG